MKESLLGTSLVTQIGILVHDIDQSAQEFADFFGVEKPRIGMTGEYDNAKTEYMGSPSPARTKQAFFDIGPNIQIELLEPDKEPSTWRHDLDTKGEGFHHIAFVIPDMAKGVKACQVSGMQLLQKGQWDTGSYSYMDASKTLKMTLELLNFHE